MGSGPSIASSSQLAPMGLAAAAIVCPPAGLAAGAIFGAGVAVGAAWMSANKYEPTDDDDNDAAAALDALDAVGGAAEAVIEYLRAAKDASARALKKLEEAAAYVEDRVSRLLRRLFGLKKAKTARREMRRAGRHAGGGGPEALAMAAAHVARSRRCITEAAAASSAIVPAAGARASAPLPESVSNSDAARIAAEMMRLILEVFVADADLGDSIPPAAWAFIAVIAAAAVICLDIVAGHCDSDDDL
ncbi:unnamed protein product [Urochloa decumbens]|uniref:Uncharacterized protein n=1 Tax=Urochloa decumbens TaxID=240449 RepID=A0ABC8X9T6_9POAL